jgi:hypothetical protein
MKTQEVRVTQIQYAHGLLFVCVVDSSSCWDISPLSVYRINIRKAYSRFMIILITRSLWKEDSI